MLVILNPVYLKQWKKKEVPTEDGAKSLILAN
jgi:hypothetical protein